MCCLSKWYYVKTCICRLYNKHLDIYWDSNNNSVLPKLGDVLITGSVSDDTIAKIGEDISKYIKIIPELRGQWHLEQESNSFYSRIVFTPQKDWLEDK